MLRGAVFERCWRVTRPTISDLPLRYVVNLRHIVGGPGGMVRDELVAAFLAETYDLSRGGLMPIFCRRDLSVLG
jgi:hypothetical protein